MPTLQLKFNYPEDENLGFNGSVKFASDFDVGNSNSISICGLGAWRGTRNTKLICVSKEFMKRILTPRRLSNFEGSDIHVFGLTATHDILLPACLRDEGEAYIISILTKFFKTISASAKVEIESLASDEDNQQPS